MTGNEWSLRALLIALCLGLLVGVIIDFVPLGAAGGLLAGHLWLVLVRNQQEP